MEHGPAPPLLPVHERVGRARGLAGHAEAARDGLDERGLAGTELALEGEQGARRQRPAERLALRPQFGLRELADHAWRRSLGAGPRRTSGAARALSSVTWSRSMAASSNSRLAA